jgi:hypothetical protein
MTNKRIPLYSRLLCTCLILLGTGCLKPAKYYTNFFDVGAITQFSLGGNSLTNAWITMQSTPTDYTLNVNIAAPSPLSKAVTITLALDTADFNQQLAGNGYSILPDSDYTVPSWTVTIPAGQDSGTFHIQISSTKLGSNTNFVLPLHITDASGVPISSNFGYGFWLVQNGNPWTGLYHSNGYRKEVGVTFNINQDKYLYYADTTGGLYPPNTVIAQAGDPVTYIDYGIGMDLTVDPTTNLVTVTSDPYQGASGKIPLNNMGVCQYDPVNKIFTLNYSYVNAYGNTDTLQEILTWKPI